MKKNMKRIVTLVLCAVMALGLLAVSASADTAITYDGGLTVDKTATKNADGSYTISLEAALKQSACDIVLVVDQSGSMNDTYMQDDGYWDYTEHNWDRNWNDNLPPFGTGIFQEDTDADNDGIVDGTTSTVTHQGPYYIYDANDDTYYELERVWCGYYSGGEFGGLYFVEYQYVDKSGNTHTYSASNVTKNTVFYTRKWVGGTAHSKKDVMQSQLKSLADQIAAAAAENGLDHRIAVVGFGSGRKTFGSGMNEQTFNYETTGLYDNGTQIKMPNITQAQYKSALKSVTKQSSNIEASINALKSQDLPALHQYGLEMADTILKNNGDAARKKIVVVVTDGAPSWTGVYDSDCANPAKDQAGALKAQGATIYTINMMENPDDSTTSFMNYISSSGCYTLAKQKEAFEAALATITENIKAQSVLPLDADTQLVDTLSTYFQFKTNPNVRYAWVSSGSETFTSVPASQYSISGKTITLDGFAFNRNISTDTTSKKLVVKFDVEPATGFLGGNGVPTNEATSAIVNDGTRYKFPEPTVDVAIPNLTVTAENKNVYLLGGVTADEMKNSASVTLNGSAIGTEWQDDFVTVNKSATAQSGLTADSTYTVSCTVTPNSNGTVSAATFTSASANINVFKPELSYSDETIYLGNTPKLTPHTTKWMHGTDEADQTSMGDAPALDITYNHKTFDDCHMDMDIETAKIGTTDVTEYVTCSKFAVHVLKPTLTANDVTIYQGQSQTLASCISGADEAWTDTHNTHTAGSATGGKPTISYTFNQTGTSITPDSCTTVTITAATANGKSVMDYLNTKEFTVHVLKPTFALTVTDLWADVYVTVNLSQALSGTVSNSWAYTGNCSSGHDKTTFTDAPSLGTLTVNYSKASHKMVDADAITEPTFTATGVSYGTGKQATVASGDVTVTYPGSSSCITLHVNTFDLTIKKSWADGTESYKQDTIFTIKRTKKVDGSSYPTNEILRVVIPKGETEVKIAGLLCGQVYHVQEETGWSWRCNNGGSSNPSGRGDSTGHDHNTVTNTAPAECHAEAGFTNELKKNQWLSGRDYVDNKWTGSKWSKN